MNQQTTSRFDKEYARLPQDIKERAKKQIARLLVDPRHPSLGVKKMEGHYDLWEARITKGYRFVFQAIGDTYLLRRIGTHDTSSGSLTEPKLWC